MRPTTTSEQDSLFRNVGPCQKYLARVPLPEGAYLEQLTGYGFDNDSVAQMSVGLECPNW